MARKSSARSADWAAHAAAIVFDAVVRGDSRKSLAARWIILRALFTRPVAFILCGEMAVAYFRVHIHIGPWPFPLLNGGEITVLYCFIFLYSGDHRPRDLTAWISVLWKATSLLRARCP